MEIKKGDEEEEGRKRRKIIVEEKVDEDSWKGEEIMRKEVELCVVGGYTLSPKPRDPCFLAYEGVGRLVGGDWEDRREEGLIHMDVVVVVFNRLLHSPPLLQHLFLSPFSPPPHSSLASILPPPQPLAENTFYSSVMTSE